MVVEPDAGRDLGRSLAIDRHPDGDIRFAGLAADTSQTRSGLHDLE